MRGRPYARTLIAIKLSSLLNSAHAKNSTKYLKHILNFLCIKLCPNQFVHTDFSREIMRKNWTRIKCYPLKINECSSYVSIDTLRISFYKIFRNRLASHANLLAKSPSHIISLTTVFLNLFHSGTPWSLTTVLCTF